MLGIVRERLSDFMFRSSDVDHMAEEQFISEDARPIVGICTMSKCTLLESICQTVLFSSALFWVVSVFLLTVMLLVQSSVHDSVQCLDCKSAIQLYTGDRHCLGKLMDCLMQVRGAAGRGKKYPGLIISLCSYQWHCWGLDLLVLSFPFFVTLTNPP